MISITDMIYRYVRDRGYSPNVILVPSCLRGKIFEPGSTSIRYQMLEPGSKSFEYTGRIIEISLIIKYVKDIKDIELHTIEY